MVPGRGLMRVQGYNVNNFETKFEPYNVEYFGTEGVEAITSLWDPPKGPTPHLYTADALRASILIDGKPAERESTSTESEVEQGEDKREESGRFMKRPAESRVTR
jgi:hypothetical protein